MARAAGRTHARHAATVISPGMTSPPKTAALEKQEEVAGYLRTLDVGLRVVYERRATGRGRVRKARPIKYLTKKDLEAAGVGAAKRRRSLRLRHGTAPPTPRRTK